MALPISGPHYKYPNMPYTDSLRVRYKQARPYNLNLPYRMYDIYGRSDWESYDSVTGFTSGSGKDATFSASAVSEITSIRTHAWNQCLERFKSEIGASAGWAENIAQAGKARQMFVGRALQLGEFAGHLRRREFGQAARSLRTPLPSAVSNRKATSQNFLEYEYGLKPIISDLQGSWELLTSDPGPRRVSGKSTVHWRETKTTEVKSGGSLKPYVMRTRTVRLCTVSYKCGATVYVNNPNLFLANQLGFLDLALPWKLLPFSFIVDWFINVEQVISSSTDYFGLSLVDPYWSRMYKGTREHTVHQHSIDMSVVPTRTVTSQSRLQQSSIELDRYLGGIPGPSLVVKPFKGFSLQRGAQAIALVLAVLGR